MKKITVPVKTKRILIIAVLVIAGIAVWLIFFHKPQSPNVQTANHFVGEESAKLNSALQKGDYATASSFCTGVALNTRTASGLDKATQELQDCIQKIPQGKVDWSTYYTLATMAHTKGDKQLELDSLKKSAAAINTSHAQVAPEIASYINARIKQLGG